MKTFAIQIILFFVFLELGSYLGTKYELFFVNATPSLYAKNKLPDILKGRTEKHDWGSWHKPNQSFRHAKDCFDVTMSFNEVGARDESFNNMPINSIFLLGDSYAEGYGVEYEDSSQYILEDKTKKNILNFGTQGIGPLSELILYENYKDQYAHESLLIYVYPSNDFTDNDKTVWEERDKTRYRPYFSNDKDLLRPYYFNGAKKRDSFDSVFGIKSFIKENFWFSNVLRSFLIIVRNENSPAEKFSTNNLPLSFYYDASIKQQKQLISAYKKINELADQKKIIFVIIPSQNDILRYKLSIYDQSYKDQYWFKSFIDFTEKNNKIFLIDLMDYLPQKPSELFFSCDEHWNSKGNYWAASTIYKFMMGSSY